MDFLRRFIPLALYQEVLQPNFKAVLLALYIRYTLISCLLQTQEFILFYGIFLFQFLDFLFSRGNSVFNTAHCEVYQDMTKPMNNYWIASSHNTSVHVQSSLLFNVIQFICFSVSRFCWFNSSVPGCSTIDLLSYSSYVKLHT